MKTVFLLLASNIFMTAAWYGHLKLVAFVLVLGAVYFAFLSGPAREALLAK